MLVSRKPVTINVVDSKNAYGYIFKSSLGAIYHVNVITKPSTQNCDILILSKKDIKKSHKLMEQKVIHIEDIIKDGVYRTNKIRSVVNNYVIDNIKDENIAVEVLSTHGIKALKKPKN